MSRIVLLTLLLVSILCFFWVEMGAKTTAPKPLVTFVELGSVNCIPCKMMQPVMKEVEAAYGNKIKVVFYDVWKPENKAMSTKYKVRVIPTQVFLDKDGKEFSRHEGFYPKAELMKVVDKQMGIKRAAKD